MALISPVEDNLQRVENNVIAVAKRVGVERVVKLSCESADSSYGFVGAAHAKVEDALRASGLPHLILRPRYSMQNFLRPPFFEMICAQRLTTALNKANMAVVDARDVAECMAACILSETPDGRVFAPSGPEAISMKDICTSFSNVLPVPITLSIVPAWATRWGMWMRGVNAFELAHTVQMIKFFNAKGQTGVVTECVKELTGIAPRAIHEFITDHKEEWAPPTKEYSVDVN